MLPLVPVQRRSMARLKAGRAIVVERTPASPVIDSGRVDSRPAVEKRVRPDRRQEQRTVERERRQGDRRRQRRTPSDRRLKALLANSDAPPPATSGTHVDTAV